jgi:hypothetical protein
MGGGAAKADGSPPSRDMSSAFSRSFSIFSARKVLAISMLRDGQGRSTRKKALHRLPGAPRNELEDSLRAGRVMLEGTAEGG